MDKGPFALWIAGTIPAALVLIPLALAHGVVLWLFDWGGLIWALRFAATPWLAFSLIVGGAGLIRIFWRNPIAVLIAAIGVFTNWLLDGINAGRYSEGAWWIAHEVWRLVAVALVTPPTFMQMARMDLLVLARMASKGD